MQYYDYPSDKIGIFENSNKNYFFSGKDFSYLCSYEEIRRVDMRTAFSGFVLVVYKRYAIVQNGSVIYKNENFCDGYTAKGRYKNNGYIIISSNPKEYYIHSWKSNLQSYELRDDSEYNRALNPIIFSSAEEALKTAIRISKFKKEKFIVAQWFDEFDRH